MGRQYPVRHVRREQERPQGRCGGRASASLPLLDDIHRHRLRRGASRRRKAKKKEAGGLETTTGSGTESGTQAEETSTAILGSKSGMVLAVTLAGNRRQEFVLRSI
jgi:hypothetical protein